MLCLWGLIRNRRFFFVEHAGVWIRDMIEDSGKQEKTGCGASWTKVVQVLKRYCSAFIDIFWLVLVSTRINYSAWCCTFVARLRYRITQKFHFQRQSTVTFCLPAWNNNKNWGTSGCCGHKIGDDTLPHVQQTSTKYKLPSNRVPSTKCLVLHRDIDSCVLRIPFLEKVVTIKTIIKQAVLNENPSD